MYKYDVFAAFPLEEVEGTRYDSIDHNDLTTYNEAGRRLGKHHYATNFEVGQYKETRLQTADISSTTFTCWTWFSLDNTNDAVLISRGSYGSVIWAIRILCGKIVFETGDGISFSSSIVGVPVSIGEHFVCVSYDNVTGKKVLYYDGAIVAEGTSANVMPSTDKAVALGSYVDGGIGLDGWLDSILFTNLVLTTTDIDWIYNSGAGRDIIEFMDVANFGSLCIIKRDDIQVLERDIIPVLERDNVPVLEIKCGRR